MGSILNFFNTLPQPAWIAIGVLCIILGFSFLYKGWNAVVLGRIQYWAGFLPLTIISPWFIHLPAKENSLVKNKEGLFNHVIVGPLFFLTAVPLIVLGTDLCGLPGAASLNFIVNGGDKSKPASILYSPPLNYQFPIAIRAGKQIDKIFNTQIYEDPHKQLLGVEHKTTNSTAQDRLNH